MWKLRLYDWAGGDVGTLTSWELCFDLADGVEVLACQLQPTASQGCMSSAGAIGSPSASSPSPFVVTFAGLNAQVNGIVFYGVTGAASATWTTQSLMCVKSPTQRLNGFAGAFGSTGGTSGACDGAYSFDMNAVMQTPGLLGTPMSAGQAVVVQGWQRDPASSKTTNLTQALSFTVGP